MPMTNPNEVADCITLTFDDIDKYGVVSRSRLKKGEKFVYEYGGYITTDLRVMGIVWKYKDDLTFSISVLVEEREGEDDVFFSVFNDNHFQTRDQAELNLTRELQDVWRRLKAAEDTI